jgi:branched-chain amino acid transport system ATP-binding protein
MFEINHLTKNFGGLTAVDDLSITIRKGEKIGLIGPNGAGKTTVFNMITGFLRPTSGSIIFNDENITGRSPHLIARKGIVRTFQLTSVFPNFTVFENIVAALNLTPEVGFWEAMLHTRGNKRKEEQIRNKALEILKFLNLEEYTCRTASSLPHGYKRILGIAIALAAEPELLLLDEPLTGMNAGETKDSIAIINKIWESGKTIFLIEHNMQATMSLCQRIVVINFGKKIAEGTPEEVTNKENVIQAYLGARARAIKR